MKENSSTFGTRQNLSEDLKLLLHTERKKFDLGWKKTKKYMDIGSSIFCIFNMHIFRERGFVNTNDSVFALN